MYVSNVDDFDENNSTNQTDVSISIMNDSNGNGEKFNSLIEELLRIVHCEQALDEYFLKVSPLFVVDDGAIIFFLERMSPVFAECTDANSPHWPKVEEFLLDIILDSLKKFNSRIWKAGQCALLDLIDQKLISKEKLEETVCPAIAALNDECFPEHTKSHINPISLMVDVGQLLGSSVVERFFLSKYLDICLNKQNSFYLREYGIKSFAELAIVVGTEVTDNKLIPVFKLFCDDENALIRKGCADMFMFIALACSLEIRKSVLTPLCLKLLNDSAEVVRVSMYKALGAFIAAFADPPVTEIMFDPFGELVLKGIHGCIYRVPYNQSPNPNLPSVLRCFDWPKSRLTDRSNTGDSAVSLDESSWSMDEFSSRKNLLEDKFEENADTLSSGKIESEESSANQFNTFRFWQLPMLELDSVLEESSESIRVSLTDIDNELSSISEKLSNWPSSSAINTSINDDTGDSTSSVSDASTPDSGWNSNGNNTRSNSLMVFRISTRDTQLHQDRSDVKIEASNEIKQDVVPQELLDRFLEMAVSNKSMDFEEELTRQCAYYFPAVVLTLGKDNWGCLVDKYRCLVLDVQWKVRYTVAASLYDLAKILGEAITTKDLTGIFKALIQDLDEVRIGILENLAKFLELVAQPHRDALLPYLKDFLDYGGEQKWRFRELLADQLRYSCELFAPPDLYKHLGPVTISLLCDRIFAVRKAAIPLTCYLLKKLETYEELQSSLLEHILDELTGPSSVWSRRVTFALLCSNIAHSAPLSTECFMDKMMPALMQLAKDQVPNVRLCVARCLTQDLIGRGYLKVYHEEDLQDDLLYVLEQLALDSDVDVCALAEVHFPNEEKESSSEDDNESDKNDNFW